MNYQFATTNITSNIGKTVDAPSETRVPVINKCSYENIVENLLRFIYNDVFH